jgi:hypothetical protein
MTITGRKRRFGPSPFSDQRPPAGSTILAPVAPCCDNHPMVDLVEGTHEFAVVDVETTGLYWR